jgi:sugar phosphate isomerase/epimerase
MKLAISNISLPAYDHNAELTQIGTTAIAGIEVAPSRVWHDTWHGLASNDVNRYRHQVEHSGLQIIGLHSLLYDQPDLHLFGEPAEEIQLLNFMKHLSMVCRDLGGRTLTWGAGRRRGAVPRAEARERAIGFLMRLCDQVSDHGTVFCFEPLGPEDDDFINTSADALDLVKAVNHRAFRIQIDAKALVENGEAKLAAFTSVKPHLIHFHANDPGLGVLGSTGQVDHAALGRHLRAVGYDGWVTAEQRMLNAASPLTDITRSTAVLRQCYGNIVDA